MSCASGPSRIGGVYGLRQPGFGAHPVLKQRQQQRNELRRSASLVLAQSRSPPALALPINIGRDNDRHLEYADWSAQIAQPVALQPLKGGHWPTWVEPGFTNDVPLRLEDCQARLAAVERELERYKQISAGGSGFRAARRQLEFFENFESHNRTPGVYHSASAPQLHVDRGFQQSAVCLSPHNDSKFQKSSSFVGAEPAPEPSMSASLLDPDEGKGLDHLDPAADLECEAELDEEDDLPAQLSDIHAQLLELDHKWQAVDGDRQVARQQRAEVEAQLGMSLSQERDLGTQVEILKNRVIKSESGAKTLREALGVSEGKARQLREAMNVIAMKEQALEVQAAALRARLRALEEEGEELRDRLDPEVSGDESPGGCSPGGRTPGGRSRAGAGEPDHGETLESVEQEVRAKVAAELALERAAAERRRQELQKKLAAAQEHHRQTEEELQRLSAQAQERASAAAERPPSSAGEGPQAAAADRDAPAQPAASPVEDEAKGAPAAAADAPKAEAQAAAEDEQEAGSDSADEGQIGSRLPELVFVQDLGADSKDGVAGGHGQVAPPLPAKCQIDLARNELHLLDLVPTGPRHQLPLASLGQITHADASGAILEIKALNPPLRLAVDNAHAASALVAALEMPNRVMPGFGLGISA